jgi:hypothetical protein
MCFCSDKRNYFQQRLLRKTSLRVSSSYFEIYVGNDTLIQIVSEWFRGPSLTKYGTLILTYNRTCSLTVSDKLKTRYLVYIQTREETELDGTDTFELDPLNHNGYSIGCDVTVMNTVDP